MSVADAFDTESVDPALRPLLRWAEPILAPARERSLAEWAAAAARHPERFDADRLAPCIADAYAAPALAWSSRALLLELAIARHQNALSGETPQARFADFLDHIDSAAGRAAIDARYPLLRADIARQAAQTERILARLLLRLGDDATRLSAAFPEMADRGRLTGFAAGLGDRHDDGASVVRLAFAHGRLVYKPRSLAIDAVYARFLDRLAQAGVEPAQRAAAVLDRGDYGYAEWIAHAPVADAAASSRYYRRYGGTCAIAYLLGCTDLHLENVIASGEHPVLVDLETVFQPLLSRRAADAPRTDPRVASVLFTGLLPSSQSAPGAYDLSGLAWGEDRVETRRAVDAGSDRLRLAETDAVTRPAMNLPFTADGARIAPHDHAGDVVAGFESTYRGLLALRPRLRGGDGALAAFAPLRARALLRSTHIYARLLDAMSHPRYLRSAEDRDAVLARLALGAREWPFLARVQAREREALLRGDVPRFTIGIDETAVDGGTGGRAVRIFDASGYADVQRRLRDLSPRDLRRQRYALAQSLESLRPSDAIAPTAHPASAPAIAGAVSSRPADFLAEAVAIGDTLLALSFRDARGIAWFQPEYRNSERPTIAPMGATLYEGLPGMMLVLAELGRCSGETRFTRAAAATLASARGLLHRDPDSLSAIGAYAGIGGWVYALLSLGLRWRREDLLDEAATWLPRIAGRIATDDDLDVVSGVAGGLMVLLRWHHARPDPQLRGAAAACAERLLTTARRAEQGAYWLCPASPDRGLTGLAHGNAGIGAALARYGHAFGDARAIALAGDAARYERAAFAARGGRWFDQLDGDAGDDVRSWCHGAPGVGLARGWWPAALRDVAWHDDVAHCVAATRATTARDGDCLCHGRIGNLDLLLVDAVRRGDCDALAQARALGADAVRDAAAAGWRCGGRSAAETPLGLMIGLAGIAYGCLRLADPVGTPSLLNLSLPATVAGG